MFKLAQAGEENCITKNSQQGQFSVEYQVREYWIQTRVFACF